MCSARRSQDSVGLRAGFAPSSASHFLLGNGYRSTRGQISFPSQAQVINQNTYDTNVGFGVKQAFRLGGSFIYLNPGLQFTIRRDTESPVAGVAIAIAHAAGAGTAAARR